MNEFNNALAEDLPFPVLSLDPDKLQVNWANHAAQVHLGRSLKSLRGNPLVDVIENAEMIQTACHAVRKNLSPVTVHDFKMCHQDQDNQSCDVQIFLSGKQLGVCIHYLDPDRTGKHPGDEAMSAIGRMLAHEIKNPLAGINGAAQLIRLDLDNEEAIGLIDLIQLEIERIGRLTDRMERLGDANPQSHAVFNVHEALQQARGVLTSTLPDSVRITEHYDPSVPDILGDRDSLVQAMINLIKNAIEAMDQSGIGNEIRLETAYGSGLRQRAGIDLPVRQLPIIVRVSNNGPAIEDRLRDKLFQPFVTSKPAGQGLGLSMVSKIVSAHGGQVELSAREGWTTFSIYLPNPNTGSETKDIP